MRSSFTLSFVVLLFATTALCLSPPITKGENWNTFHVEGGCFNDLYDFGTTHASSTECRDHMRVYVIADFSEPSIAASIYEAEYKTLHSFVTQLSEFAFPSTDGDGSDESLWLDVIGYNTWDDTYWISPLHSDFTLYPNKLKAVEDCETHADKVLDEMYDALVEQQESDSYYVYNDDTYLAGLETAIRSSILDYPVDYSCDTGNCFVVFARVNPAGLSNSLDSVLKEVQKKGFLFITLDNEEEQQASVASWLASQPYNRFAHILTCPHTPRPELLGTKMVQSVRGGSSACMMYGLHHVLSFDGVGFTQQQLGDFVLVKDVSMGTFEVQVRNEWCYPNTANAVCTTGLAVRVGQRSLAFYYDVADDRLAVTVNGELVAPGHLVYDEFDAIAVRHNPNGFEVSVITKDDTFTSVYASFNGAGSVAVYPSPALRFGLAGLCGTYDGCALDEFYTMQGQFVEDVNTFANSWQVTGGSSIFEQPKYLGLTAKPFVLHQPFITNDWEPFALNWTLVQTRVLSHCEHFVEGPLYDACVNDQTLALTGFEADLMLSALQFVCPDMCETEFSRMGGFTDAIANCSLFCDTQMADLEGIPFTFPTGSRYQINMPVATSNFGRDAFFLPPLGGDYLFHVSSTDCCADSEPENVYVTISCENQIVVDAKPDFNVTLDEFGMPVVELRAYLNTDQVSGHVHVIWEFIDEPTSIMAIINNPHSLTPTFIPQAVGAYTLQVIATDGCSVSSDTIIVNVMCYKRDYKLQSSQSDTMMFYTEKSYLDSFFSTTFMFLDASCVAPIGIADQEYMFPWSFATVDWTVQLEYEDETSDYWVISPDSNPGNEDVYHTMGWLLEEQLGDADVTVTVISTLHLDSDFETTTSFIPTNSKEVAMHEYPTVRAEALGHLTQTPLAHYETRAVKYTNYLYVNSTECWLYSSVKFEEQEDGTYTSYMDLTAMNAYQELDNQASLGVSQVPDWLTEDSYPEIYKYLEDNEYFHTGHCPGKYSVSVTLHDEFACEDEVDTFDLEVSCVRRPLPLVMAPCFPIYYDYMEQDWPCAVLYGTDSVVPAYRDMEAFWIVYDEEGNEIRQDQYFSFVDTLGFRDIYLCISSITDFYMYDDPYVFSVSLVLTDHCSNVRMDDIEVSFTCIDTVDAVLVSDFEVWPQTSGNLLINGSLSTTNAYFYGASLKTPDWDCYTEDDDLNFWIENFGKKFEDFPDYACEMEPEALTAELISYCEGAMTVSLYVDDGCAADVALLDVNITCTANWNGGLTFTDGEDTATSFTVTHDLIDGWPEITITAFQDSDISIMTYAWFAYNNNTKTGSYSYLDEGDEMTFSPTAAGSATYAVAVYDGCKWGYDEITILSACSSTWLPTPTLSWDDYADIVIRSDDDYSSLEPMIIDVNLDDSSLDGNVRIHFSSSDASCVTIDQDDSYDTTGSVSISCSPEDYMNDVTITVYVEDGCLTSDSAEIVLSFVCPYTFTPVASTDSTTVTWSNGAFPVVCVSGQNSTWTYPSATLDDWEYVYIFTSTPEESVYRVDDENVTVAGEPYSYSETHVPYDADLDPYTDLPSPYKSGEGVVQDYTVTVYDTMVLRQTIQTTLNQFDTSEYTNFVMGGCFRPDVPGTYTLRLDVRDSCNLDLSSPEISITAACTLPTPAISIVTPTNVVVGERYEFEATVTPASADYVYTWEFWYSGDDSDDDMSDRLTNGNARVASFIPAIAGEHHYKLTVTDGCHTISPRSGILTVGCTDPVTPEPHNEVYRIYDYDGIGNLPVYMSVDNDVDFQNDPRVFQWELVGFMPHYGTADD